RSPAKPRLPRIRVLLNIVSPGHQLVAPRGGSVYRHAGCFRARQGGTDMCNRITQFRSGSDYISALGWDALVTTQAGGSGPRYNVAPGASTYILHQLPDGLAAIERVRWGSEIPHARAESMYQATVRADESLDDS